MNTKWKRFAPFGLYLALVAALAGLGLFIVQRQFNLYVQIALGVTIIGLALYAILDPGRVRESFTGRQARFGSNVLVMTLAFIGILVVVNFLANKYTKRWDLTNDKTHTLAPETIQTLKSLKEPVVAIGFFTSRVSSDTAKGLLADYQSNSDKFSYKFIDPEADPVSANNAKITQDGTIALQSGGHQELVTTVDEQDLSSALIRLANPGNRSVYFLTGHGEHDITGSGDTAFATAKQTLVTKNYTVNTLDLISTPKIPTDALAIIIAGPQKPLSESEVTLLKAYVDKGGALVVMEDPTPITSFGTSPDPLATYLTSDWNIVLDNDLVIDTSVNPATIAAGVNYGTHAITDKIKTMATIFPTSRSVSSKTGTTLSGVDTTTLVSTAQQAWGETNFTDLAQNKAQFDQGTDIPGPLGLAVASQNTAKNSRVVVFGGSTFAADRYITQYGNTDMFANAVDWAAGQQNLINLTAKAATSRVMLQPQAYQINLLFLGVIILIPGLVLFSGIMVWVQRRRRG